MKDIKGRNDIELLVDTFYNRVLDDEMLGPIFKDIARIELTRHMPIMYNFWETTLFHTGAYKGNPMEVHARLNVKIKLTKTHFDQWLALFETTVDELFDGEIAHTAKTRARSIATVMQIKMAQA